MSLLSNSQVNALRNAAYAEGLDPEALVAAAEGLQAAPPSGAVKPPMMDMAGMAGEGEGDDGGDDDEECCEIEQWQLPFVRVRELRAALGLTDPLPDDDMLCPAFAKQYGGAELLLVPDDD